MHSVKSLFVIIARDVSTDATDNMNSIIKIIDRFTFNLNKDELDKNEISLGKQQIALPANYSVATSWIFEGKTKKETLFNFGLDIIDPDGKKLGEGPKQKHLVPKGIDRFNMNFNIQVMPVTKPGRYLLQATIQSNNGKILSEGTYPYEVQFTYNP